jgi:hypothetical protein
MTPHHDGGVKERSVETWALSHPDDGSVDVRRESKISIGRSKKREKVRRLTPPSNLVADGDEGRGELKRGGDGDAVRRSPADGAIEGRGDKVRNSSRRT